MTSLFSLKWMAFFAFGVCVCVFLPAPLFAQELDTVCRAYSDYDISASDAALVFERHEKVAQRVEMRRGALLVDGRAVALSGRDRDRLLAFEITARSLIPQIRALGQRAVDLSAAAVREAVASVSANSAADPRLNARLAARAQDLKDRMARSSSSKEWRGSAFKRYTQDALRDLAPVVAESLGHEAMNMAVRGDLNAAAALTERALNVGPFLETRIQRKLEALRPDIEKLCPALRGLDALESDLAARLTDGTRLNLIEFGNSARK